MTYHCTLSELMLDYSEAHIEHIKKLLKSIEQQLVCYRQKTKKKYGTFLISANEIYRTKRDIEMLRNEAKLLINLWDGAYKQMLLDILDER